MKNIWIYLEGTRDQKQPSNASLPSLNCSPNANQRVPLKVDGMMHTWKKRGMSLWFGWKTWKGWRPPARLLIETRIILKLILRKYHGKGVGWI